MLHGPWKQLGVIVALVGMPIIPIIALIVLVLVAAFFSSLAFPR
jgi:hypothetical protein